MAVGLPDYYRGIRPRYGAAGSKYDFINVGASEEKSLCTVTGKGVIYGGFIRMLGLSAAWDDKPKLLIDGKAVSELKYSELLSYGIDDTTKGPLFLTYYDMVNWIYCVGISAGMTFESTVEIRYHRSPAVAKPVRIGIIYALI